MDISSTNGGANDAGASMEAENSGGASGIQLLNKALRMLVVQGPEFTARRAIWRFEHERFQRRRKRHTPQPKPSVIRFQDNDFELHGSNEGLSEELRMFGVHEPTATRAYLEQLSPGDHVVDVGSNLGYYLLLAARKVGPQGRLLGFEPSPGVYDILARNIARSHFRNIQTFPYAVSDRAGVLQFFESEVPNWGSLFQDETLQQTRAIDVQTKTLDDIVSQTPGFHPRALRMDVEGAELMVLKGAREVLREYKPFLFIEFHNFALGWETVRTALTSLGQVGYSSGVLIERTWDQPWMNKWMRARRSWRGSLDQLLRRVESPADALTRSTLIFILKGGT